MKQPDDISGGNRKTLLRRKTRKAGAKPEALKGPAKRRRVLGKGSDQELVKAFGEK